MNFSELRDEWKLEIGSYASLTFLSDICYYDPIYLHALQIKMSDLAISSLQEIEVMMSNFLELNL